MGDLPVLIEYVIPDGRERREYWNSLGIGTLRDVIDLKVTEDLFGTFHIEMLYPEDGHLAREIKIGKAIKVRTRQEMTEEEQRNYKAPGSNGLDADSFYNKLGWEYQIFFINDIAYDTSGVKIVRAVHYTYRATEMYMSMQRSERYPKTEQLLTGKNRPLQIFNEPWFKTQLVNSYYNNNYVNMTFYDSNGNVTNADTPRALVNLNAVTIIQDIDRYTEKTPWNNITIDNWAPRNYLLEQKNFHEMLLGDDEKSMRNLFGFEVLRDRWGIILTDRRSLKSWDTAYELRYGRDMKEIKLDMDLSDILTSVFPYFVIEDEYTYRPVNANEDVTVTCKMEVNLKNDTYDNYPIRRTGDYMLVPASKASDYMFKGIRMDVSDYVDKQHYINLVKDRRTVQGGVPSYTKEGRDIARWEFEKYVGTYLQRANMQFGEVKADVDLISLWDTREAFHKPHLQKLRLGDPVIINHEPLGLRIYSRVTETNYNPLTDKYDSIKLTSYSVVPY